jgi:hypothetical protein
MPELALSFDAFCEEDPIPASYLLPMLLAAVGVFRHQSEFFAAA